MEIKDYLHLYLGCNLSINDKIYQLRSVDVTKKWVQFNADGYYGNPIKTHLGTNVKLVLRKLSSMTPEEDREVGRICREVMRKENVYVDESYGAKVKYLLSLGFDLFGLIENGLAIDLETINNNPVRE